MTDRQPLHLVMLFTLGELVGELVADHWPRPAEVEQNEQHRRMLAEIRARLEERQ